MSQGGVEKAATRASSTDARQAKRLHLLEVAAGEFAREGFERANINAIAELAGFGKGTVYLYAASKEQLFRNVLEEIGRQTSAALNESLTASTGQPAELRLRALADAFAQLADEHPDFVRLQASALFGVNRRFQEVCAEVLRGIATTLADAFQSEEAQGTVRQVPPEALALLLMGALQLLALLPGALALPHIDASSWRAVVSDVLWRGLRPEGPEGSPMR